MDIPFMRAAGLLCESLRNRADALSPEVQRAAEEIRLRLGQVPKIGIEGKEYPFDASLGVRKEELSRTVELCTRASLYAREGELSEGYLSAPGGHRVGICGRGVIRDGQISGLADFSSLCIRIARSHTFPGDLPEKLLSDGIPENTLILSPPGYGKTTLLRDTIRRLSEMGLRVGVADERGEVCAVENGVPGFDMGPCTDILTGMPKADALYRLCRCMAPRVIAVDEITEQRDCRAILSCTGTGVAVLATAHGRDASDLLRRPLYRMLTEAGVFRRLVLLGAHHRYTLCPFPES